MIIDGKIYRNLPQQVEKNKGHLSDNDAEDLKHKVDDLTDDGKLNDSGKEHHK